MGNVNSVTNRIAEGHGSNRRFDLFQPDFTASDEFRRVWYKQKYAHLTPTKRLLFETLFAGLAEYINWNRTDLKKGTARQDNIDWVEEQDDGDNPFSFNSLCEEFGIDPGKLREAIKNLRGTEAGRKVKAKSGGRMTGFNGKIKDEVKEEPKPYLAGTKEDEDEVAAIADDDEDDEDDDLEDELEDDDDEDPDDDEDEED